MRVLRHGYQQPLWIALLVVIGLLVIACRGRQEAQQSFTGPSSEKLKDALLTLEDLPEGWTLALAPNQQDPGASTLCGVQVDLSRRIAAESAAFQRGQTGLAQAVLLFHPRSSEAFMSSVRKAIEDCRQWQSTANGTAITWKAEPLSFAGLGDEMIAVRLSGASRTPIEVIGVYLWRNDVVDILVHTAIGSATVDINETERFVRLANEKLQRLEP